MIRVPSGTSPAAYVFFRMRYPTLFRLESAQGTQLGRLMVARAKADGGRLSSGNYLWKDEEYDILRQYYPDYKALQRLLPNRTLEALRKKAHKIGLTTAFCCLTYEQSCNFRRLYPIESCEKLLKIFPFPSRKAMNAKALRMKLKKKTTFTLTGQPKLDALRARCAEIGYTMADLDEILNTGKYFSTHLRRTKKPALVMKGIAALGGHVGFGGRIEWDER